MANPLWPEDLPPLPIQDGFSAEDQDSVNRFYPTYGEPMFRLGSTATPIVYSVVLPPLTLAQRDSLMSFYRSDLAHGSLEFDHVDPEADPDSFPESAPTPTVTFVFLSSPRRVPLSGDYWQASFQLMQIP